jgi:hypothetical protein
MMVKSSQPPLSSLTARKRQVTASYNQRVQTIPREPCTLLIVMPRVSLNRHAQAKSQQEQTIPQQDAC